MRLQRSASQEAADALKEGDLTGPSSLRRAVREEVARAVEDKEVVEAALAQSLTDGKWVSKIEGAVLQFLRKDFDKVLALGADAYHFRRWDELQAELRDLRKTGVSDQEQEVSYTRELVGNVRDRHNDLSSEVIALRERLELASERLEALEGHSVHGHEALEWQKAFHFKILEEQSNELRDEVLKVTAKLGDGFRKDIEALQKDVQGLHHDRIWLHRQEEALSSRCRDLEKRLEDSSARTQESHAAAHAAAQEAKGETAEVAKRLNDSHANLTELCTGLRERIVLQEASKADLRKEVQEHVASIQALVAVSHAQTKSQRDAFGEDLRAEQRSSHEAMEARVHGLVGDKIDALDEELKKSHAENKVLRAKLEKAVVKGYEAVEAQFREALGQQVAALRADLMETQAQHAERHKELQGTGAQAHAALEQRLLQAVQEQHSQLQAAHETGHKQLREEVKAQLHSLRADLEATAKGGQEAVQGVEERLRDAREALEGRHADVAQRLAKLDAEKELGEQRHRELRSTLEDGDQAVERRLEQSFANGLHRHSEAAYQQSYLAVSKEHSHKLNAMAYSMLEVIGEVQLMGSPAEVQTKRSTLHNRLCDRLGGRVLPPGEEARDSADAGKASRVASSASTRPGTSTTRPGTTPTLPSSVPTRPSTVPTRPGTGPLQALPSFGVEPSFGDEPAFPPPPGGLQKDAPPLHDFGDGPVSLPAVPGSSQVAKPSQPSTPKPTRPGRFGDSLREIRSLRLSDYNSNDWGT